MHDETYTVVEAVGRGFEASPYRSRPSPPSRSWNSSGFYSPLGCPLLVHFLLATTVLGFISNDSPGNPHEFCNGSVLEFHCLSGGWGQRCGEASFGLAELFVM